MNMARSATLALCCALVLLLPSSLAVQPYRQQQQQCRIDQLSALSPSSRLEFEGGWSEFWDWNDDSLQCAGVSPARHTIQSRGLLLPSYSNSPRVIYIVQGEGFGGLVIPGCPATFQSLQQSWQSKGQSGSSQQQQQDEHQKIHQLRQGDVLAVPAGVSVWAYNQGQQPLVAVVVLDTSNYANQLDSIPRRFFLAGGYSSQSQQSRSSAGKRHSSQSQKGSGQQEQYSGISGNVLKGFAADLLAEALGVDQQTAKKLQGYDDQRGAIVLVQNGLQVVGPTRKEQEQWRKSSSSEQSRKGGGYPAGNGIEESLCNLRLTENIGNPMRADVYSQEAGHLTTLNSHKLPILRFLQLTAEKGHLHKNAILAPHWNVNAHSITYIIKGSARVQIVGNNGRPSFDDQVREGQFLVVPQNYAVVVHADKEDVEWVAIKTSDNAITNQIAGKGSAIQGIPIDVLANSYGMSSGDVSRLKQSRKEELSVFSPWASM